MEVFPTLDLSDELKGLLEFVRIDRVTLNRDRDFMRIFLESEKLIFKKHIFELEQAIMDQLFSDVKITVKIIEKFHLSKQYSPANFLEVYRASMELELKNYNMLEYNLFKRAQISFPSEEEMNLLLPDSVIAREKSEILVEYLHKVFCERCGMNLKIQLDFQEMQESKYRKNAALQIRQEVANVLKHAKLTPETAESSKDTEYDSSPNKNESLLSLTFDSILFINLF